MNDPDIPLTVDVARIPPDAVVSVVGEIDPHTAGTLTEALDALTSGDEAPPERVVLDLSGVTFVDSSGLRVLLTASERMAEKQITFTLRSPSEAVHRLLEITKLLDHLGVE